MTKVDLISQKKKSIIIILDLVNQYILFVVVFHSRPLPIH